MTAFDPTRPSGYQDPLFEIRTVIGQGGRWEGGYRSAFSLDVSTTAGLLWPAGAGVDLDYLTSAETMDVVSTSALDAFPAGTGARRVLITGLDDNFLSINEIVELDGVTPVVTTLSYLRINQAICLDVGVLEQNAGDISITATTAMDLQAFIPTGLGKHLAIAVTTPADRWAILCRMEMEGQGTDSVEFLYEARHQGDSWRAIEAITLGTGSSGSRFYTPGSPPVMIQPESDLRCIVRKIQGGGTTGASSSMSFYSIDKRQIPLTDDLADI